MVWFISGFILDIEKYENKINYDLLFGEQFKLFVQSNGKIYPSKPEHFYSINSSQLNNFIQRINWIIYCFMIK